jgi:hypothetical protein
MSRSPVLLLAMLLILLISSTQTVFAREAPTVLGWVEEVAVMDAGLKMHAKIDTGADNSSINASGINYFTRQGARWVRFSIQNRQGMKTVMERPLVRVAQIKRKEGGYIERPVVNMDLCVGGQKVNSEVNLADRNHFKYLMLVGRSLLARRFLVDPESLYLTRPACVAA